MRTELPAERIRRRLSGESADPDPEPDPEEGSADTSLSKWLPEPARGGWTSALRADPGRSGAIALAVVGAVAVAVTVFTLAGRDEPQVVAANLPSVQPVSSAVSAPGAQPASEVIVSVVGLVNEPGLVTLTSGARVADALHAAGGALPGADLTGLNMARRVSDGEQIIVGIAAPPGVPPVMGSSVSGGASGAPEATETSPAAGELVDLNAASVAELDALPGVGPVTAEAIVAWRTANGSFANVDQLGEVDGIGPARLSKLRDLVKV